MLSGELQRVEDPQHFVEVAAGAHGIDEHQFDLLVGTDDEDRAHGGVVRGGAALGGVTALGGQHPVEFRDLKIGVADHRIVHFVTLRLLDIGCPPAVIGYRVDAQSNDLCISFGELGLKAGHVAEFGGADGREVFGVRKEDRPAVTDPLVEVDLALCGLGGEVRCFVVNS